MQRFRQLCNLETAFDPADTTFALHNGGQVIYQTPNWGPLVERLSLLWRYGPFSLLKLDNFIANLLDNFGQIYPRLSAGVGYPTVVDLLTAMSPVMSSKRRGEEDNEVSVVVNGSSTAEMVQLTKIDLTTKLRSLGIGELLLEELVMVASKVNYGQLPSQLHSLVGSVSLAGVQVERIGRFFAGNWLFCVSHLIVENEVDPGGWGGGGVLEVGFTYCTSKD
jgi:hypothetical protein